MRESVAQRDARWSRFDEFAGARSFIDAGLRGHGRSSFYTLARSHAYGPSLSRSSNRIQEILEGSPARNYFLAAFAFAYFFWKRSTRPAVSTSFCFPVKNGWQFEQISTFIRSPL